MRTDFTASDGISSGFYNGQRMFVTPVMQNIT
jgi:hypothetical protein